MKVIVRKRFIKDASLLKSQEIIGEIIFLLEIASHANYPEHIPGFKNLTG